MHDTTDLARDYLHRVRALARSVLGHPDDVDDVVQETFLVATARLAERQPDDPWPWLARITTNLARNARRRRGREAQPEATGDAIGNAAVADGTDSARQIDTALLTGRLRDALAVLPAEQHEAIRLTYLDGISRRDAARELGVPFGTLQGRVRLGLDRLRRELRVGRAEIAFALAALAGAAAPSISRRARAAAVRRTSGRAAAVSTGGVPVPLVASAVAAVALLVVLGLVAVDPFAPAPDGDPGIPPTPVAAAVADATRTDMPHPQEPPTADAPTELLAGGPSPPGDTVRRVRFRLVDQRTGAPVHGNARMAARGSLRADLGARATAAADGTIDLVLPGHASAARSDSPLIVSVAADGYASRSIPLPDLEARDVVFMAPAD